MSDRLYLFRTLTDSCCFWYSILIWAIKNLKTTVIFALFYSYFENCFAKLDNVFVSKIKNISCISVSDEAILGETIVKIGIKNENVIN